LSSSIQRSTAAIVTLSMTFAALALGSAIFNGRFTVQHKRERKKRLRERERDREKEGESRDGGEMPPLETSPLSSFSSHPPHPSPSPSPATSALNLLCRLYWSPRRSEWRRE
jgi:hypothetical protein